MIGKEAWGIEIKDFGGLDLIFKVTGRWMDLSQTYVYLSLGDAKNDILVTLSGLTLFSRS